MKLLDIILEAEDRKVYVIGDSIAVGIANAASLPTTYTTAGKNSKQVLEFVRDFVASGKAPNATVILSSGASNSTFERMNGEKKTLNLDPIADQLRTLKDAGATVFLVGTGSKRSKTFKNKYGEYFINFEGQQVNQKLASLARQNGVTFLGPLENYDSALNTSGDGIHPGGSGSSKLFKASMNPASIPKPETEKPNPDVPASNAKQASFSTPPADQPSSSAPGKFVVPAFKVDAPQAFLRNISTKLNTASNNIKDTAIKGYDFLKGKKKNPVSPDSIKQYLKSKGLDINQIAGILANIQHESGFDSGAIGDKGTSGGLVQHHATRFAGMVAHAGGPTAWATNWQGQLDYALQEPAGQQYASLKFTSPEQATKWWTINFERPANMYAQANIRSAHASRYV